MSQFSDDDCQFVRMVKDADPLIIISSDSEDESIDDKLEILELERFLFCMIGIIVHYFYFSEADKTDEDDVQATIPTKSQIRLIMKTIKQQENQFGESSCFIRAIEQKLGRKLFDQPHYWTQYEMLSYIL